MNPIRKKLMAMLVPLLFTLLSLQTTFAYYDPGVQRWLNRDPIGEYGFEALRHHRSSKSHQFIALLRRIGGNNLYAFVQNEPTGHSDPLGLVSLACESAIEQAEAAQDLWMSEPSAESLAAFGAAIQKMIKACKPPPLPPTPPWCPPSRWVPPYIPPLTPPQQQACGWAVVGGAAVWICIIIFSPVGV